VKQAQRGPGKHVPFLQGLFRQDENAGKHKKKYFPFLERKRDKKHGLLLLLKKHSGSEQK